MHQWREKRRKKDREKRNRLGRNNGSEFYGFLGIA
jgi:hypothetical protein